MRNRRLVPLLTALALALAACSSTTSSTQTSTSSAAATTSSALTLTAGPNGTFTDNFNPFSPNANSGTEGMIYEPLLFFNRLKPGSVTPWLASSYAWSNAGKTVTFQLRKGVTWSDGKPFTSADVAYTLNLVKSSAALNTNNLQFTSVQTPTPSTVVVNFAAPAYTQLWYLAGQTYIVPQHIWQHVSNPVTYADTNPVGTGAFTLKSFTPELYLLARNPHYWQPGKPAVSELRYPAYTSNSSADLILAQGAIDWTGLYAPNIQQTFVARSPSTNHYWFPASSVVMLYLNNATAPFNNVAVRQAVSDAISRTALSKLGESGYEQPASPTGLVLPADKKYMAPSLASSVFKQNLTKAKSLLASAGYHRGPNGMMQNAAGQPLAFNINVVSGWTDWVSDCQIMANDLHSVGIAATVNTVSFGQYFSALQKGSFQSAISWTNAGPTPYYLYNSLLNSANTSPVGQVAASNFERWSSPATDALLNQYATSSNAATQQAAIAGLEQTMASKMPSIPLVYAATWAEWRTSNFVGWPTAANPYALPAPFSYPDAAMVVLHLKKA